MSLCEEEYTLLKNKWDWKWYKSEIDLKKRCEHKHIEEPERFPCLVNSYITEYTRNPNECRHSFLYEEENLCSHCGHKTSKWPTINIVGDN